MAGVFLAMRRRLRDYGAAALQSFGEDFLPLILLFAISATGLMLTASYTWMKGYAYEFLAVLHAVTVIFTLLWLPFGKLFHIFQRPAHLAVAVYKDVGRREEQAECRRCGQAFASLMHVQDLITVEGQLGYRYEMKQSAADHYQWICPPCRRALFGLAQAQLWAAASRGQPGETTVNTRDVIPWMPRWARRPSNVRTPGARHIRPQGLTPWLLTAAFQGLNETPHQRTLTWQRHRPPASNVIEKFGPHLAYSVGRRRARGRAGQAGEDALLLLRPAVRHSAEGQGQPGRRLRAVGGVPLQPRHALSQGRQALPARRRTRIGCCTAYQREPRARHGFIADRLQPGHREGRRRHPAHPVRRTAPTPSPSSAAPA